MVGRDQEFAHTVRVLTASRSSGVVLVGVAGVGRTRLADEVLSHFRACGWLTLRVPGMQAMSRTSPTWLLDDVSRIRTADEPLLIVLDDAHLLDPASAAQLHVLVADAQVSVLATVCSQERLANSVIALWKDGLCERIEVAPLQRRFADEYVISRLGGEVSESTLGHLWRLTNGNMLYLNALITGCLESGTLVKSNGVWSAERPFRVPSRLVELIQVRLKALPPAQIATLEMVLAAQPAGVEVLTQAGADPQALESLERSGLVLAERSRRRLTVRLTDPLVAQVLLQETGRLRMRSIHRSLAAALDALGSRRKDDPLRLATSLIAAGEDLPAELGLAAARCAAAIVNFPLAERLARAALDSGAGSAAVRVLAEALMAQDRAAEAELALSALRPDTEDGEFLTPIDLMREADLQWALNRRDSARLILERLNQSVTAPGLRAAIAIQRSRFLLHEGKFGAALKTTEAALASTDLTPSLLKQARATSIPALVALGRTTEATALSGEALASLKLPDEQSTFIDQQRGPVEREQLATAICRAYLVHGWLAEAHDVALAGCERATAGRFTLLGAWWASQLADVAIAQGRPRTALGLLSDAGARVFSSDQGSLYLPMVRATVLRALARAAVLVGDLDVAERALAEMSAITTGPYAFLDLLDPNPAVWLVAAYGDQAQAIELAVADADRAATLGARALELQALHQVVRLGQASDVVHRMTSVGSTSQGPLASALIAHAVGQAAADATQLESVAQHFYGMGARLLATEAAAESAQIHQGAGRDSSARRVTALATRWMATCEEARTPGLEFLTEPPELTPRQREIARLAARGMASKAIAAQLALSVRTVDNYLGQIYRKLGIGSREELAVAMGLSATTP
jgi:DNA-binding NarL/FixJ family response regulator